MPPRPSIADRLPELVDAATAVFADKGYKATQMADVAAAMGVAPGSLYNYVEGKEGLFALCLDSMMREGTPPPDMTLPLPTPPLEVTLRRLDERAKALLELPALNAALERQRPPAGAGEELAAVVAELYDLLGRLRHATDMIERSARDLPELASLFYHEWRRPLVSRITAYLQSRMDSGQFRRLDDLRVAAVFVLETVAWSASHRFHDPDGRRLDDASTRTTIIDLIVGTFMPRGSRPVRRTGMTRDVSPGDAGDLGRQFGDRLLQVRSPWRACTSDSASADCAAALSSLRNPYWIEDQPGGYHTTGWLGAYEPEVSSYAVAVETSADIAAAVRFARDRGLRLAVKGTGHDYLGRSRAAGSLMIWTHLMREVTVHDGFVPTGSPAGEAGVPAITVGAGTRWLEAYQALLPHDRYVQGGGCVSVGAAGGFIQGGGFGSLSRRYGTAAGNMLEAEVVLASGEIVTANAVQHPDLFWALRGGGGGTFGVVSRLTLRTYPAPRTLGLVSGTITASSDAEFRRLLGRLAPVLPTLCDDHWGEHVAFAGTNVAEFGLLAADLPDEQLQALWAPFLDWVTAQPDAYRCDVSAQTVPFLMWDHEARSQLAPDSICHDDRPGAPPGRFWNAHNQFEVSWYLHAYQSHWLPRRLLDTPDTLADTLFRASRPRGIQLDFNKALSGAAASALARDRATAINPAVFDAAALALCASWEQYAYPGVPGHEPDPEFAEAGQQAVSKVMDIIRAVAPDAGSYVNETDYHQRDWQRSFWGDNYARLLEIKHTYDPGNLFRVHHGVGSER